MTTTPHAELLTDGEITSLIRSIKEPSSLRAWAYTFSVARAVERALLQRLAQHPGPTSSPGGPQKCEGCGGTGSYSYHSCLACNGTGESHD